MLPELLLRVPPPKMRRHHGERAQPYIVDPSDRPFAMSADDAQPRPGHHLLARTVPRSGEPSALATQELLAAS